MPLQVNVVTPDREVWSGDARMVVARGVAGEVGILAGHAPMLVRLGSGPVRIEREGGGWDSLRVEGGFLHVTSEGGGTRVAVLATSVSEGDEAASA